MNLNPAHIHLILNHIPILGTMIFAPLVLIWGLARHSRDITQTGLLLAVILALTTIPIYLTGEPAEEQLERQPWFSKTLAETHEERAEGGLVAVLITGAGAAVALWRGRKGGPSASSSRVLSWSDSLSAQPSLPPPPSSAASSGTTRFGSAQRRPRQRSDSQGHSTVATEDRGALVVRWQLHGRLHAVHHRGAVHEDMRHEGRERAPRQQVARGNDRIANERLKERRPTKLPESQVIEGRHEQAGGEREDPPSDVLPWTANSLRPAGAIDAEHRYHAQEHGIYGSVHEPEPCQGSD